MSAPVLELLKRANIDAIQDDHGSEMGRDIAIGCAPTAGIGTASFSVWEDLLRSGEHHDKAVGAV